MRLEDDTEVMESEDKEVMELEDTEVEELEDTEVMELEDTEVMELEDTEVMELEDTELMESDLLITSRYMLEKIHSLKYHTAIIIELFNGVESTKLVLSYYVFFACIVQISINFQKKVLTCFINMTEIKKY